ncbi:LPS export ABC transporter periplasmic protein LptC [Spirochaeta cellobiosiphila]|uniref:LPS export ABC transporter periplasmic protein LptC n=1 Tax=Spirochaeta cellobiosiphila TaxID=504483 RepID=UPI000409D89D|nr:LPS export ABC transporter periplasmic protein LptC [Spirochaeta cellobiosiphila]
MSNKVFIGIIVILLSSCSLDYEGANLAESLEDDIPNSELDNFKQTVIEQGQIRFSIEAQKAKIFTEKTKSLLYEAQFNEFEDGQQITHGQSDYIMYDDQKRDANLKGNIIIDSLKEATAIKADELNWNEEKQTLAGTSEGLVRVEQQEGSLMYGTGFEVNLKYNFIRFNHFIKGQYASEN